MDKHQQQIEKANQEVNKLKEQVKSHEWNLQYHVMPQANWMNDPNGFSFFMGEYHLFYQHHPYDPKWGPMHWGHVKSKDLVHWEHLPIALAPSEDYDKDGCFSGSAIEKDGKLYLMYTGNVWIEGKLDEDLKQVQAIAVSDDGIHFEKIKENPVISEVPEGDINIFHFRDPKVWKHEGAYYCVLGSKTKSNTGQVLLYRSSNLIDWEFVSVMAKGEGNFGFMWECPDLFELEGKEVLVMSPQGVKPEGNDYHNLHQAGYVIGQLNYQTGIFQYGPYYTLDHGFDFYAPQTMVDDKGRRILIGWMDMWESDMPTQEFGYSGAMTIPRIVSLRNDRLYTLPVPELEDLREEETYYSDVLIEGETSLKGVHGDCLELKMKIDVKDATTFGLKVRQDAVTKQETVLTFDKRDGLVILDRTKAGKGPGGVRKTTVSMVKTITLQIFIDKSSVEIFINEGEKVMSARVFPTKEAQGITFFADHSVEIKSLSKWSLKKAIK
ncbi:glycoside hydrolase family 32 protein [Halalkalibacter alkaliphilus]|uniref:Sucrose-6-phosphate hydrolase n=1 Tax=Halalkalibacter alkaliphilus TaxID=2917993 RepID=A0A9X2A034_9BACI|nr:glycoside hydrolase family 32 protein [Halalkalibacter alkaliphilus]MCL7746260.1 glycoside hydrolase family 32 protein [Halalkalibacter alkaliphilus]